MPGLPREPMPGPPVSRCMFVFEYGPWEIRGMSRQQALAEERKIRNAIDSWIRDFVHEGPQSKYVRSRIERLDEP